MRRRVMLAGLVTVLFLASCSESVAPAPAKKEAPPRPDPPKITQFYASPAHPRQGEKTLLCYGVENAKDVRLDPPVEEVWPALSRCFEVKPKGAAKYTLSASGPGGSVSQSLSLTPAPPAVEIIEVSINKLDFTRGETATVCYKAKNAKNVSIRPGEWIDPHTPENGCIQDKPQRETTYVVTATGAGGETDTERVTARVK